MNDIFMIILGMVILLFILRIIFSNGDYILSNKEIEKNREKTLSLTKPLTYGNRKIKKLKEYICGNCKSLRKDGGFCVELKMSIAKHKKACLLFDPLDDLFSTEQEDK